MTRRVILILALLSVSSLARADAIRPFEGECPPGLERAIRDHSEACVPRACAGDGDCGSGAGCIAVFECWAERAAIDPMSGHPLGPRPTALGACDASRSCAEGACRERRQCEPTAPTPAWDPATHSWTRTPFTPPAGMCSASHGQGRTPLLALALVLLSALGRRRRA